MSKTIVEPSAVELISTIACSLVDNPEGVSIKETSNALGTVLHLKVDPAEVGKLIGKQGRTARSMRIILGAVSVKLHHRYSLEIVEGPEPAPSSGI